MCNTGRWEGSIGKLRLGTCRLPPLPCHFQLLGLSKFPNLSCLSFIHIKWGWQYQDPPHKR